MVVYNIIINLEIHIYNNINYIIKEKYNIIKLKNNKMN